MNQESELTFEYEDKQIRFVQSDKNVMVNATEMAKVFDKRIDVFLKSDHAKAFMQVLEFTPYGGNSAPLTQDEIIKAKGQSGTYMHRILALKFAAWLHPAFEVWIYATMEQILYGHYQQLEENLKETAQRRAEIKRLQRKLYENEDYQLLEQLKLKEKQATAQRSMYSKSQLEIFKGLYDE